MTPLHYGVTFGGAIVLLAALWVVLPQLALRANKAALRRRCRARRAIAITFDDGPGTALTPAVLERLRAAGVRATFFVLGDQARRHPEQLERIRAGGHELGSHGDRHVHHLKSAPLAGIADTRAAWGLLAEQHRLDPVALPFRPPYGKLNLLSWLWLVRRGVPIVMWTHDSWDTRPDLDRGAAALAADVARDGGGVVLLHDFDRDDAATHAGVLARLDALLALGEKGFEFVTAGELSRRP